MLAVKSKVLVVEDELLVARDIEQQLLDLGYHPVGLDHRVVKQAIEPWPSSDASGSGADGHSAGWRHGRCHRCARHSQPVVRCRWFFSPPTPPTTCWSGPSSPSPLATCSSRFPSASCAPCWRWRLYKHQAEARLLNSTRQLKALSTPRAGAQELERRRVAHELHDELGQSLTAIKINLQRVNGSRTARPAELNPKTSASWKTRCSRCAAWPPRCAHPCWTTWA
jgi:signal transduction histidine kinase